MVPAGECPDSVGVSAHRKPQPVEMHNDKIRESRGNRSGELASPRSHDCRFTTHLALFMLMLIATVTITCLWVLSEQDYYQGDGGRTHQMAIDKAALFRQWPGGALYYSVKNSLIGDYNEVVVLPIFPFVMAFGNSRLAFELALVLLYQLPFALVVGAIATKLIPVHPSAVFWSTTGLALLTPAVWVPTLRGLPDMCSAFLVALAVLLYLRDKSLRRWWQIPTIGLVLATAVILRRHFAYGVVALFVSWGVMSFMVFVEQWQRSFRDAVISWSMTIVRIGLVGVSGLAWAALLAWPFLETVYRTDFTSLYSSYVFPPNEVISFYILIFGWGPWVLAGVGYISGAFFRKLNRDVALFFIVFGLYSYAQWAFVVGQRVIHFASHFSMFVVLGLSALVWVVWQAEKSRSRLLIITSLAIYLAANAVIGMVKLTNLDSPGVGQIATSFAPNHSPIVRKDYGEIGRLVEYLRKVTSRGDRIYVAAGSFFLDYTLLVNTERTLYGRDQSVLAFIATPVVDSNHDLPLSALLAVQYVVVPSAVEVQQTAGSSQWEYHLPHDQQTVVKVASLAFTENWPIAKDFSRLPEEFILSNGTHVNIYRRVRPTSLETVLTTLEIMEKSFRSRPGGQLDWIVLESPYSHSLSRSSDGSYSFRTNVTNVQTTQETRLLYIGTVPAKLKLSGALRFGKGPCASIVALNISTLSASHNFLDSKSVTFRYPESSAFAVPMDRAGVEYLLLNVSDTREGNPQISCQVAMDQIRVGDG